MALSYQKEDGSDLQLVAKIDNANIVLHLLKTISFRETATVCASANGLKVTVEEGKTLQANAFIQAEFFQDYHIKEEVLTFKINLWVLVECLSIFGSRSSPGMSAALKLMYNGHGSPLVLLLEEGGAVTDCKIVTRDACESLDFNFSSDRVVNKLIMRSECLREVFSELDQSSAFLSFHITTSPANLRLSTSGNYGVVQTDIPGDSEMIETFKCSSATSHSYRMSLLHTTFKALAAAQKVSLRVDERGFMCLQFMIKAEGNEIAFVEFFCCPEEELMD
ncbi:cell cycle checkpoint protein RAD1 [Hyalella azteca]|uniref:Cell cycle checkpoint protein RAD1 n=1 Tax=Hyalella azteca TaxID=294128 RepID=A0A8B7N8C8_HYAAZ|nr:cell cycle checkpoint protein RAD1 [Hyalella azteca]